MRLSLFMGSYFLMLAIRPELKLDEIGLAVVGIALFFLDLAEIARGRNK